MTTLSKEDVVRVDNDLLAMIQKHFPSLPLDDRYTDWGKWLGFAKAVYSHGEQAARADLVAENERLKAEYAEDVGKLLRSTKYIAGIAERGLGTPQPDSVAVEDFVLGYVKQLEQRIAASQATNEKLREFVKRVSEQTPEKPDYWSSCSQCEHNASDAEDLAALPNDTTALREMIAGVYEECAKVCENSDRYRGDYFAAKIRELAEKAKA